MSDALDDLDTYRKGIKERCNKCWIDSAHIYPPLFDWYARHISRRMDHLLNIANEYHGQSFAVNMTSR